MICCLRGLLFFPFSLLHFFESRCFWGARDTHWVCFVTCVSVGERWTRTGEPMDQWIHQGRKWHPFPQPPVTVYTPSGMGGASQALTLSKMECWGDKSCVAPLHITPVLESPVLLYRWMALKVISAELTGQFSGDYSLKVSKYSLIRGSFWGQRQFPDINKVPIYTLQRNTKILS